MLFLVPDPDDTPNAAAQPQAAPTNVELDLDDAPFLSAPEPEPTEPPPPLDFPEKVALPEPDTKAKGKGGLAGLLANKKRLILIGASLVLLVVGAVVVNMFLFSAPEKPKEAPTQAPKPEARKVVVPSAPSLAPAPPIAKFMITWPAFNVPLKGAEGEVAIFTITLTIPIDEPLLKSELEARNTVLRDAVYYYLSRKTLESLMDSSRAEELREQLVQVINEHMTSGKIQKVFIEDFYSGGM